MNIFTYFRQKFTVRSFRGFVLPLTLIVCVIILTIATGISVILAKELYFSKLSRLSQIAYYAADNGLMCATMVDDQYVDSETGLGIFQYANAPTSQSVLDGINTRRVAQGLPTISLNSIKCATSDIFNTSITGYTVTAFSRFDSEGNVDNGRATTFNMRMDMGNSEYRCATIVVNKTPSYRQIISRGFASCNSAVYAYPIERAIVSTSQGEGIVEAPTSSGPVDVVLTSGTSWTVPQGITSLKVWAIGGGGGGAGSPPNDGTSGGGGGAGGLAYREYTVSSGQVISYTIGSAGTGGSDTSNGNNGGDTQVTVSGVTIHGNGGRGGRYDSGVDASGGSATGGSPNRNGGRGKGVSGDMGGGGGGALGNIDGTANGSSGGAGGQAADVSGYFAVISGLGYATTGPGAGGGSADTPTNAKNGTSATGFGSGGGGAGYYGGNGGNGLYGGGGGGAAGFTASQVGGNGGQGVVIISGQ